MEDLICDTAENRATGRAELVRAHYEGLSTCGTYITDRGVTLWMGDVVGTVTHAGRWHRQQNSYFGTKWRQITVRDVWGRTYTGREYTCQQIVRLRRTKGGV